MGCFEPMKKTEDGGWFKITRREAADDPEWGLKPDIGKCQ